MRKSLEQGWWELEIGDGPIVATSVHSGHALCPAMAPLVALPEEERLREEDPFTDRWTAVAPTRAIGCHSRFGWDLNRPREKAVYLLPEDAWGLKVWRDLPGEQAIADALHQYDEFYRQIERVLRDKVESCGGFVLLDLHSYNHRREGMDAPPAAADLNPDINIGTGTLDRTRWGGAVDRLTTGVKNGRVDGRPLDVRENIRFFGGHFPGWINSRFAGSGCAIAIEVKKFFMDEWTGRPDPVRIDEIRRLLQEAANGLRDDFDSFSQK